MHGDLIERLESIYRAAENAEVECSQEGCRRRDCNGVICRRSIDVVISMSEPAPLSAKGGSDA